MYLSDSPSLFHCLHRLSDLRSEIYSQRLSLSILIISISYNYLQSRIYLSPTLKPVLLRQWHVWLLELTVLLHSEEVYSVSPLHTSQYAIIVKPINENKCFDPPILCTIICVSLRLSSWKIIIRWFTFIFTRHITLWIYKSRLLIAVRNNLL